MPTAIDALTFLQSLVVRLEFAAIEVQNFQKETIISLYS